MGVSMGRVRRVLRWILLGRRSGTRARVRRTLGVLTWLDGRADTDSELHPPSQPSEPADSDVGPGWLDALGTDELAPGDLAEVVLGGRALVIANVDGSFFAIDAVCPHAGGALGDGFLDEGILTCSRHGWTFDVRNGECQIDPDASLRCYETRLLGNVVQVQVPREGTNG